MEHSLYEISASSALETGALHMYLEHSRRTKFIISPLNSLWPPQRRQLFPPPLKNFFLWVQPVWKLKAWLQVSQKAFPQNSEQVGHLIAWTIWSALMKRTRSIASSEAKSTTKPPALAFLTIIHFKNKQTQTNTSSKTTPKATKQLLIPLNNCLAHIRLHNMVPEEMLAQ